MQHTINTAKKEIENMIKQYFQKDENGTYKVNFQHQLPIFLVGPAGIGKTQIVGEMAEKMDLGFVSYSLVHHTRQTLMGLPVIHSFMNGEMEIRDTEYTLSELLGAIYKQISEGKKEGILLLDEANCCPETIQPILLSFLQSKMLGSNSLPEGWVIVLCGNPPQSIYNKNARKWDGALMDRLRVIELGIDNKEYLQYVFDKDFHPAVKFYLTTHTEDAYICEEKKDGLNLVTYRTWENISNAIYDYEKLGFEVTPVMINEYIKVDRIVKAFYELYRYSILDVAEYTQITKNMLDGNMDMSIIKHLRDKPMYILYGIANICFRQLSEKANELFSQHEFLKEFKTKIYQKDFNIQTMFTDDRCLPEMRNELEKVWKTVGLADINNSCIEIHNKYVQELNAQKEVLIRETKNFITELEKLDNKVLVNFYMNAVERTKSWIYVMAN